MYIMPESGTENRKVRGGEPKPEVWRAELLAALLLFGWAFFINRGMRISGLYMDDLYTWSCWGEQGIVSFLFPVGSTRNRFVYWLASWIELAIIGNRLEWIVPINICLNAGLAYFLYRFSYRLSKSRPVGLLSGIVFLTSHFSYYQIGQMLGLMETMGIFFALLQSWCLYRYLKGDGSRFFGFALLSYFLNCFTHERYLALFPMFFYCLFVKREKNRKPWIAAPLVLSLILGIRFFTIGTLSPAGTGGTQLADTFTLRSAAVNFCVECLYCIGVNAGPEHLSGIPWQDTPFSLKMLVLLMNLLVLSFALATFFALLRRRKGKGGGARVPVELIFFFGFMVGCMAASSVTIRVEMRWLYVVYAFLLLFLSSLFGAWKRLRLRRDRDPREMHRYRISDHVPQLFLALAAGIAILLQCFYRTGYEKLYLFPDQERYNSLADTTVGTYGREVLGKEIIILGNSYKMSEFTAKTFFKTFDPARTGQGTSVRHVERLTDFGQVTENMLILQEDPAHNRFLDITEPAREMKLEVETGYYRDGWMDEEADIRLLTGKSGEIRMHCMYPGDLRGDEYFLLRVNQGEAQRFVMQRNVSDFSIQAEPRQIAELTFCTSFHVENAAEQRGEKRLAMIVNFTAE